MTDRDSHTTAPLHFIGTPLDLLEQEVYRLSKYLHKQRAQQKLADYELPDGRRVTFDLAALGTLVQLDCANCHRAHSESCCEGGYPFPPATELLPVLTAHAPRIAELLEGPAATAVADGRWLDDTLPETEGHPTIGTHENGNCLFCRVEGAGPACMAHRHALQSGHDPHELKPLSCLLYPLDLIGLADGCVLVTALTEATAPFSRWGPAYLSDYVCGNYQLREQIARGERSGVSANVQLDVAADAFALHNYRPAYVEGRATLVRLYGPELWDELHRLMS